MGKTLHVGNLASSATVADLLALFGQFGVVESANVDINPQTGLSNGVGSVQMSSNTDAAIAKNRLNFTNYDGLILSVRQLG